MGSKVSDAATFRGRFHDVPNRLGRDSIALDRPQPIDSPEDRAILDGSRRGPLIDGAFHPHGNRNGTDVLSFANQVSDYPMLFANLEIFHSESNQFSPSQTASDEQRQESPDHACLGDCLTVIRQARSWTDGLSTSCRIRTPRRFAPLTRRIPAARSGLRRPVSEAS